MPHLPFACIKYSDSNNFSFLISECSSVSRPFVELVTVYEPEKDLWIDYRFRKPIRGAEKSLKKQWLPISLNQKENFISLKTYLPGYARRLVNNTFLRKQSGIYKGQSGKGENQKELFKPQFMGMDGKK